MLLTLRARRGGWWKTAVGSRVSPRLSGRLPSPRRHAVTMRSPTQSPPGHHPVHTLHRPRPCTAPTEAAEASRRRQQYAPHGEPGLRVTAGNHIYNLPSASPLCLAWVGVPRAAAGSDMLKEHRHSPPPMLTSSSRDEPRELFLFDRVAPLGGGRPRSRHPPRGAAVKSPRSPTTATIERRRSSRSRTGSKKSGVSPWKLLIWLGLFFGFGPTLIKLPHVQKLGLF